MPLGLLYVPGDEEKTRSGALRPAPTPLIYLDAVTILNNNTQSDIDIYLGGLMLFCEALGIFVNILMPLAAFGALRLIRLQTKCPQAGTQLAVGP